MKQTKWIELEIQPDFKFKKLNMQSKPLIEIIDTEGEPDIIAENLQRNHQNIGWAERLIDDWGIDQKPDEDQDKRIYID